ncbi:putative membrane protein [Vibrio cholerae HC-46A1]|nr:putative membrane protein [Vibrio cholerae CP1038(11)]EJH57085.1 putative membrane protein [Vibrio cholerae HC-46A1]
MILSRKPSPSKRLYSFSLGLEALISLSVSFTVFFAMMGTPD